MFLLLFFFCLLTLSLSAQVPELNTWCPNCPVPPASALQALFTLQDDTFKNNAKCGDNICNTAIGESCGNCPTDCGKCEYTTMITSCVKKGHISLTFDDGPTNHLNPILDTLKQNNVIASFFLNGVHILKTVNTQSIQGKATGWTASPLAQAIKRAHDEGHIIGTHTYSHIGLALGTMNENVPSPSKSLTLDAIRMQLLVNDLVVFDILNKYPVALRPPYLEMNGTVLNLVESMGYIPISINLDTLDYSGISAADITSKVMTGINTFREQTGFLTLQHDGYPNSVQALSIFIPQAKQAGMVFVDLPTCLGKPASAFYRGPSQSLFNTASANVASPSTPSSSSAPPTSPSPPTSSSNSTLSSPSPSPSPSKSPSQSQFSSSESFAYSKTTSFLFILQFTSLPLLFLIF